MHSTSREVKTLFSSGQTSREGDEQKYISHLFSFSFSPTVEKLEGEIVRSSSSFPGFPRYYVLPQSGTIIIHLFYTLSLLSSLPAADRKSRERKKSGSNTDNKVEIFFSLSMISNPLSLFFVAPRPLLLVVLCSFFAV